MTFKNQLQN